MVSEVGHDRLIHLPGPDVRVVSVHSDVQRILCLSNVLGTTLLAFYQVDKIFRFACDVSDVVLLAGCLALHITICWQHAFFCYTLCSRCLLGCLAWPGLSEPKRHSGFYGGVEMARFSLSEVCRMGRCLFAILVRLASAGWYAVTNGTWCFCCCRRIGRASLRGIHAALWIWWLTDDGS